jgi:hypothetical protein
MDVLMGASGWQIGMAYDMFVGDNVSDEGPCPPGQIIMLVRTLPQVRFICHYRFPPTGELGYRGIRGADR